MDHLSKEKLDDFIKKAADYSTYHEPTEYWTESWLKVIHLDNDYSETLQKEIVEIIEKNIGENICKLKI